MIKALDIKVEDQKLADFLKNYLGPGLTQLMARHGIRCEVKQTGECVSIVTEKEDG